MPTCGCSGRGAIAASLTMSRVVSYRRLKTLYTLSPQWLKRTYSMIPFAWRAGPEYRRTRRMIRETEHLPWDELRYRQLIQLRRLLQHAVTNVPFYQDAAAGGPGPLPEDPETLSLWFERLPLIEKSDLQLSSERFRAQGGIGEAVYTDNTGGSSGTPFEFLKNNRMYPIEQAYMMDQWSRVGYRPGDRKLTLRGRTFSGRRPDERWHFNPIYNELAVSSYHLDEKSVVASFDAVSRFRPEFVHGYPAAIVTYLRLLEGAGLQFPDRIRAVFCGSEPTYDYQRKYISESLGCRVYSWYGQSECVILAGECEHSQEYHSFPLYGVLELVDDENQVVRSPGVEGEIVGTSLNNRAMPFIRYRTGDRGIYSAAETCACGRSYRRLKHVTGRKQHFVYTAGRRAVPVTAFVFGQHFDAFRRICAMQLVQEQPGRLGIRVVRGREFSDADERELREKMQASVDNELAVEFEYVDQLAINQAGKTDFVIQHVKDD